MRIDRRVFLVHLLLVVFLLVQGLTACSASDDGERAAPAPPGAGLPARVAVASSAASARPPETTSGAVVTGDAERGSALVARFECNRCHDGTGQPAMATEKHCTHCHEDIATGRFGAGSVKIAEWRRSVEPYRDAPSLDGAGKRFRPDWIARFLQNPEDLRPNLAATMPRLAVSPSEAADLAAYLTRDAGAAGSAHAPTGSVERGRASMEAKGCGSCHTFTGVPPLPSTPCLPPQAGGSDAQTRAIRLAPDLRITRERFRADTLASWLLSPSSLKPGTPMPSHALTEGEATDIAAYLTRAELTPPDGQALAAGAPGAASRPLLARPVSYREVETRVLAVTCRHCHGDPDVAGGDGGPGNTGGFGFAPRGLDLSTYRSAASGVMRDDGRRHSLFERTSDGTPLLVAALRARQREEAGQPVAGIRGMPLGLPAVSPEDVQLVETWIAQGRPR